MRKQQENYDPTVEGLRGVLEELAQRNPKAKDADPKRFFDDSFVRDLLKSGFIYIAERI